MATINDVETNGNPKDYKNTEEAVLTLNNAGTTQLVVMDQKGLDELKEQVTKELGKINSDTQQTIEDEIQDMKSEFDTNGEAIFNKAKEYTDKRMDGAKTQLIEQGKKLGDKLKEIEKSVTDLDGGMDGRIDAKVDAAKAELEPKITAVDTKAEANKSDIAALRRDMNFANNGSILFAGIVKSHNSTDIQNMNDQKDTWLTAFVTGNGFPDGPKNGYFVMCKDNVCFYFMNNTWIKGNTPSNQTFGVKAPLTFQGGTIELTLDPDSGLEVSNNALTFNPANNTQFNDFCIKDQDEQVSGEWTFEKSPKVGSEATEDAHLISKGQTEHLIQEAIKKVPGGIVYSNGDGIEIDNQNVISLKVKPNSGLTLTADGLELDGANLTPVFEKYTKKDEEENITAEWTFETPPVSLQPANDDNEIPNWKQVQEHVTQEVGKVNQGGNQGGQTVTYVGVAPIKVDGTNISLELKTDGGLIVDGDQLAIDPTKIDLTNLTGLDAFAKKAENEEITGGWTFKETSTFEKAPVSATQAQQDNELPNLGQVKQFVQDEIAKNPGGGNPGQGGQQPGGQLPNLDDYTKRNVDETIENEWTFNTPPRSTQEANHEHELVNFKQVKELVKAGGNGGGGNGGAINPDELKAYTKKAEAERITAQWEFATPPTVSTEAKTDNEIPNYRQVAKMIKTGANGAPGTGIPDVDDIVDQVKTEVEGIVEKGKNDITKQTTEQMGLLQSIVTNGTTTLNGVKDAIDKLSETELKKIDETLKNGDVYFQNLLSNGGDLLTQFTKEKEEELSDIAKRRAQEVALACQYEKTITFETVDENAGSYMDGVIWQEVIKSEGRIIYYGDFYVKGQHPTYTICGDDKDKTITRVPLPNDVEFDYVTIIGASMFFRPKKGQKDVGGIQGSLDNYFYCLGYDPIGMYGAGRTGTLVRGFVKLDGRLKKIWVGNLRSDHLYSDMNAYYLLEDGRLFAAGFNGGSFGLGKNDKLQTITKILDDVEDFVGGYWNIAVRLKDGKVKFSGLYARDWALSNQYVSNSWLEYPSLKLASYMDGMGGVQTGFYATIDDTNIQIIGAKNNWGGGTGPGLTVSTHNLGKPFEIKPCPDGCYILAEKEDAGVKKIFFYFIGSGGEHLGHGTIDNPYKFELPFSDDWKIVPFYGMSNSRNGTFVYSKKLKRAFASVCNVNGYAIRFGINETKKHVEVDLPKFVKNFEFRMFNERERNLVAPTIIADGEIYMSGGTRTADNSLSYVFNRQRR